MGEEDLENFESELEMQLYREYRDVLPMFTFAVETEKRFYLANQVDLLPQGDGSGWLEVVLSDVWVWDMYRPARFVPKVRVMTTGDVNVEELSKKDPLVDEPGVIR